MTVHPFGIRHHGPGSARSLVAALDLLEPDAVLIEGPPDADKIIALCAPELGMEPPVALLTYLRSDPSQAAYFPMAAFSPEWQAIQWALRHDVTVAFMDLPMKNQLAKHDRRERYDLMRDPLRYIAEAAGYGDSERWWEAMIEERRGTDVFEAISETMCTLRETFDKPESERSQRREAYMRQTIRTVERAGHQRIAAVCGAWHVPALIDMPTKSHDSKLLRGMPRVTVDATWVPWTHGRLSIASGYGAGVRSPGWYHHLFTTEGDVSARWLTKAARLLRDEGIDASSAHVIETMRLAEALAALRNRPLPGLEEHDDAIRSVMLFGDDLAMRLVDDKLVVGEALGRVPAETPAVPLQRDLQAKQRRLRLRPSAEPKEVFLDLRKPTDRQKSQLLRQLQLLDIPWGNGGQRGDGLGTFREVWLLEWSPDLSVCVIEASMWGHTVGEAAAARAIKRAAESERLPALTTLAKDVMFAGLLDAIAPVTHALGQRAAVASDVSELMSALPELVALLRYGDVRETDGDAVRAIVDGLAARTAVGLCGACASLNDDAAAAMFDNIEQVQPRIELARRQCARRAVAGCAL